MSEEQQGLKRTKLGLKCAIRSHTPLPSGSLKRTKLGLKYKCAGGPIPAAFRFEAD